MSYTRIPIQTRSAGRRWKMPHFKMELFWHNVFEGLHTVWFFNAIVFGIIAGSYSQDFSVGILVALGIGAVVALCIYIDTSSTCELQIRDSSKVDYEEFVTKNYPEVPELSNVYLKEKWENEVRNFHLYNHQNYFDEKCFVCIEEQEKLIKDIQ